MKKDKKVAMVKKSRKLAEKELEEQIIGALKSITEKFATKEKKVNKIILKNAKQLSGKLAKQIEFTISTAALVPPDNLNAISKPISRPKVKKEEVLV